MKIVLTIQYIKHNSITCTVQHITYSIVSADDSPQHIITCTVFVIEFILTFLY